MVEVVLT